MFLYGFDYMTLILLVPAMLFSMWASFRVRSTFAKYAKVKNSRGITGHEMAEQMLRDNGIETVYVNHVQGNLSDHYDPRNKMLNLSDSVYNDSSVAALAVACHEVGHAIQHSRSYKLLAVRNAIAPVARFASSFTWIIIMVAMGLMYTTKMNTMGMFLLNIGILIFVAVVIFHMVTLPVELNASKRAMDYLKNSNIVYGEEAVACKKVLSAAALTYVAATAVALVNLIRLLIIRGRSR